MSKCLVNRFLLLTLTCSTAFTSLFADTYTVTPADDLEAVLDTLTEGDTLILEDGLYPDPTAFLVDGSNGTVSSPITVRGASREGVIVRRIQVYCNFWNFEDMTVDADGGTFRPMIIEGHHVNVRTMTLHNALSNGIDIRSHDILVEDCIIHQMVGIDSHGISVDPGADSNTIRGCTIYDCTGDCIQIYNDGSDPRASNTTIESCRLYTTRGAGSENAIDIKASNVTLIANCVMWGFRDSAGSDGTAVVLHQNSDNVTIDRCLIYDSLHGIRSGNLSDGVTVQRTTFFGIDGGSYNWAAIQIDGTQGFDLFNCTFDIASAKPIVKYEGTPAAVRMYNNIFVNSGLAGMNIDLGGGSADIDANLFWNVTVQGFNAVSGSPLFVSQAAHNYNVQAGSPAVDAGRTTGLTFRGTAPDLGAWESGDSDADGMPDAWEEFYFGDTSEAAAGDWDNDSTLNLAEYTAGTDPAWSIGGGSPGGADRSSGGCTPGNGPGLLMMGVVFLLGRRCAIPSDAEARQ